MEGLNYLRGAALRNAFGGLTTSAPHPLSIALPNLTHTLMGLMLQKFDFIWTSCGFLKVFLLITQEPSSNPDLAHVPVCTSDLAEIQTTACPIGGADCRDSVFLQELKPCELTREGGTQNFALSYYHYVCEDMLKKILAVSQEVGGVGWLLGAFPGRQGTAP